MVTGSDVTAYAPILKPVEGWAVGPNLVDYERECAGGFWERPRRELGGFPGGGLNIAYEAVDRHVATGRGDRVALRWLGKKGVVRDFAFAPARPHEPLRERARVTRRRQWDLVCALAGRIPELYVTALGKLKHRSAFSPLFSAFGPEPIRTRLSIGKAKVLVTTEALHNRKVAAIHGSPPHLEQVVLIGEQGASTSVPGTEDYG